MAAYSWDSCLVQDAATIQCLEPLFQNAVTTITALAGIALLVMLFIAGFNFLFSGGDPKKLETARGTLTNAIIGLVVIAVAYLLLFTIQAFTGVPITTFTIPSL